MLHGGRTPNLALLNKKVDLYRRTHCQWPYRLGKQTAQTQVPNSRCILTSFAMPVDPDALRLLDPREELSRIQVFNIILAITRLHPNAADSGVRLRVLLTSRRET